MSTHRGRTPVHPPAAVEAAAAVIPPSQLSPTLTALANLGQAGMNGVASALDYKVLVLNKAFVAVRVISARRAFSLICREIAEVIHVENGKYLSYDFESWAELSQLQKSFEPDQGVGGVGAHDWVHTVRFDIAVPRIIRLLGYDRLPAQIVKLNRRNLFARDRNQCQYCGRHFPTNELSIDHVLPRAQGGGDSWENLVCACIKCNARKGGRTPDQAHMKMMRLPIKPKRNPLISIRLGQDRYHTWKAFLDDAYWNVELK
jgi:5-methylcytosine-specific restriction endonuclease McrA